MVRLRLLDRHALRNLFFGFFGVTVFMVLALLVWVPSAFGASYIVPCGNDITHSSDGSYITYKGECDVCDLSKLGANILSFLILILVVVAAILFVNAGVLYLMSSANPGNIARAHKIFTSALIGLVIVLAAYLLIDVLMKTLLGGEQLSEGRIGTYGPWNEILCIGDKDEYKVKVISKIDLIASKLILPKASCSSLGGACNPTCSSLLYVSKTGTDCENNTNGDTLCCVPKWSDGTTYGDTCRFTEAEYVNTPASCTTAGSCPTGKHSETSTTCGTGMVCCEGLVVAPESGAGYCAASYLTTYFGAAQADAASCICKKESSNGDATAESGSDVCAGSSDSFSIGLWQINLTVHKVGGLDCPSAFNHKAVWTGSSYDCKVTDRTLYDQCKAAAKTVETNIAVAVRLYNERASGCGWDPWECSARKCNVPVCSNYCPTKYR